MGEIGELGDFWGGVLGILVVWDGMGEGLLSVGF